MTRATTVEDNVDEIKRRLTLPLDNLIKHHTIIARSHEEKKSVSITNDLIAGGIGGIAGVIVGHPFDSIKVRYQMAASTVSSSSNATLKVQPILNVSSLFRGISAPVTTAALVNASVFMTYGESSRLWDRYINFDSTSVQSKQIVCGAFTGLVSSFIVSPTELVKIQMQTQNNGSETAYRSSSHAARSILSNHGIQGLYRGFISTCFRQSLGFSVYFASYNTIKDHLRYQLGTEHVWLPSILAGGVGGCFSWSAVYPIDYIKSRIQAIPLSTTTISELSIWSVAKNTIQQQGWKSLYRGLGITVLRAFPVNGIIFPTYELTLSILDSRLVKDVE